MIDPDGVQRGREMLLGLDGGRRVRSRSFATSNEALGRSPSVRVAAMRFGMRSAAYRAACMTICTRSCLLVSSPSVRRVHSSDPISGLSDIYSHLEAKLPSQSGFAGHGVAESHVGQTAPLNVL